MRRLASLPLVCALLGGPASAEPPPAALPPIAYVGPAAVEAALRALESDRAKVVPYGRSAAGRPLLALRIGRSDLPQVLVHGGVGARDAAGAAAALDFARRVLAPPETGAPDVLGRAAFWVIPAPNPDALAAFLREGAPAPATQGGPDVDRDRDGRVGEDGPDDVDGDGEVLWMRRPDPVGVFAVDEAPAKEGKLFGDPRLLRSAGVDGRRAASFSRLDEGTDRDGDGEVNEDPPGVDLVRHFPGVWEEVGPWPGDGAFPGLAPEVRALLDLSSETAGFVAWYAFASEGPVLERASERGDAAEADKALYDGLGAAWKKATGLDTRKASDRGTNNAGSELDWACKHLGLVAVRAPVWRIAKAEANGRERADADELDWLLWDDARGGKGFSAWKPFAHPTLGPVEIGGWRRFTRFEPPADLLEGAVRAVSMLPATHADFVPRLGLVATARRLGGDLYEVEVRARNLGGGPTDTKTAEAARRHMPVRVAIRAAAGATLETGPSIAKAGVLAAGAVSEPLRWTVRRAGAGALATAEAFHRTAGRATQEVRTP